MNVLLKKHFENYGFDEHFFAEYEQSTADEMKNARELCSKLLHIRDEKKKIVIYTDFDVDGIMSSVVAYAGLSELGFNASLFDPTPANGYGFRVGDVEEICNTYPDVSVILTGDVGVASHDAIAEAHARGLQVLVTDHHIGKIACTADVTVNPNQFGETYSHNGICGSYVLYKVIEMFANMYGNNETVESIQYLKLFAGIATISDSMPLLYENRQLVRDSVSLVKQLYSNDVANVLPVYAHSVHYVQPFIGIKELLKYFADNRKIKSAADINEQFYGFYLVPFLNSCKRMDGDMRGIYDIFFGNYVQPFPDFPNMACVKNGIAYIARLSEERKKLTTQYFDTLRKEKEEDVTDNAHYMQCGVFITNARAGLLGLLGGKFFNLTGQPTLVVNANSDGSYSGSGRNPSWFDFASLLHEFNPSIACDGHREAFGIAFPDKQALDSYIRFFRDVFLPAQALLLLETGEVEPTNVSIGYAADVDFAPDKTLVKDYLHELEQYRPYGRAFPEPVFDFCFELNDVNIEARTFGGESQHLRLKTPSGIDILMFGQTLDYERAKQSCKGKQGKVTCIGTFHYDTYNKTEQNAVNFIANDFCVDIEE